LMVLCMYEDMIRLVISPYRQTQLTLVVHRDILGQLKNGSQCKDEDMLYNRKVQSKRK